MDVSIVGNFHVIPISSQPLFSRTGKWYDFFSGDSIDVTDVNMLITLQPGEFKIYTTVKLPTPEPDLLTEIKIEISESIPSNFELHQNYPNPFNPSTKIRYAIPAVGTSLMKFLQSVQLKVYDVLGNEVATLVDEEKPTGSYEVEFNAINLSSGIYFYQLRAGSFVETKKIILLH